MSQQINLYEARLRPRCDVASARNLALAAALLLVLMTALASWLANDARRKSEAVEASQKQVLAAQEKLTVLSKKVAERAVSPALAAEIAAAKAALAASHEVMAILDSGDLGNRTGFSALMSGFSRQTQPDLWLTGFVVSRGGDEIEIRGRLLDPAKLPVYVQRLSSEPVFQGRRFDALEMRDVEPEAQKTASPAVASVEKTVAPDANAGNASVAQLPRYVEFVLRSAHVSTVGEGRAP